MSTTERMTAEDLERIIEVGRHDLIRGELITHPPGGALHGVTAARIGGESWQFATSSKLGQDYVVTGFILQRDPDTVLGPDIAFVRAERRSERIPGYIPGPPDLAVEVVSQDDSQDFVNELTLEYLLAGTRLVWLVYPQSHSIVVFRADRSGLLLRENDRLDGEDVLPGFSIKVSEMFE